MKHSDLDKVGQLGLFGDERRMLNRPMGTCPICQATGIMPCGWWTGPACFEDNGRGPRLHAEGQPNVHGRRPFEPDEVAA